MSIYVFNYLCVMLKYLQTFIRTVGIHLLFNLMYRLVFVSGLIQIALLVFLHFNDPAKCQLLCRKRIINKEKFKKYIIFNFQYINSLIVDIIVYQPFEKANTINCRQSLALNQLFLVQSDVAVSFSKMPLLGCQRTMYQTYYIIISISLTEIKYFSDHSIS